MSPIGWPRSNGGNKRRLPLCLPARRLELDAGA
jgi:hypothetical protein